MQNEKHFCRSLQHFWLSQYVLAGFHVLKVDTFGFLGIYQERMLTHTSEGNPRSCRMPKIFRGPVKARDYSDCRNTQSPEYVYPQPTPALY